MINSTQENLIENKENPIKNQNIFLKYFKWKYFFIIFILFLNPLKLNIVLDNDTYLPIDKSIIEYKRANLATGCGNEIQIKTFYGFSISPTVFFPCAVSVSAPGYHKNGDNNIDFDFNIARLTLLKKQKSDYKNYVRIKKKMYLNDKIDILTFVNNKYAENIDDIKKEVDFDFFISEIVYGGLNDYARFKFNGNGGVQAISSAPESRSAGNYYFDLENLTEAPEEGYFKEFDIATGKSYVAKLIDGKHYVKFHTFISEDFETNKPYICITGFLSTTVGKNLDFFDIGDSADFSCDYEKEDGDLGYNDKVKFSIFQKDFSGKLIAQKYQFNTHTLYLKPENYSSNQWYWLDGITPEEASGMSLGDIFTAKIPTKEDYFNNKFNFEYGNSFEGMPVVLYSKGKEYYAKIHRLETIDGDAPKNEVEIFLNSCESRKEYPSYYKECLEVSF